jgi:hypothetical protein
MNPELTAQLLALPALREQAEEDARAHHAALCAANPDLRVCTWGEFADVQRQDRVNAMAALLANLTRWQSQVWALRRIGELLGWRIGDDVPTLYYSDPHSGKVWTIKHRSHAVRLCGHYVISAQPTTVVDGLHMHPGRVDAIAAILLHLSGGSNG